MSMLMIRWVLGRSFLGRLGDEKRSIWRSCSSREARMGLVPLELIPVALAMVLSWESLQVLSHESFVAIHDVVCK